MGWLGFGSGEKSEGETGRVTDVQVNIKTDDKGRVTDVLVNEAPRTNPHSNHTHYYEKNNSSWGIFKKGRG